MTSISIPTCHGCDQLTTRSTQQARRPRIAIARSNNGHRTLWPSLRTLATQLRAIFGTCGANNRPSRQAPPHDNTSSKANILARAFGHPDGAGFIGPGADALLRGLFTEALASQSEVAQVITTRTDLDRLFGDAFDESSASAHAPRLHIMDSLEDAIEHLELEAEMVKMISASSAASSNAPAFVWLATPGPDADVVHETLRHWPDKNLLALLSGPWPYGPTHLIEQTGPRPRPNSPLPLPTPQEAIKRLTTGRR
ncbi:hypothetical protein [Actinomadura bangladeshensis]|uniref:Uncharacterized protein n=1 Tax=Actinomadura bangladeshensis TaxID=453573 RepID=A0A4V2XN92_9ACTN|nr:hypothetical protein [Actinomadura bangladeshensis]TDC17246.1 hypothetical protein E1284_09845 [Actinomadura bangladeshensis]